MQSLTEKDFFREKLKKKRIALNKAQRTKKSEYIISFLTETKEFKESKSFFCYISYMNEVETDLLINNILEQSLILYVPKVINDTEMVAVRLNDCSDLKPDSIGILAPESGEILLEPIDMVITPGIGFTKTGDRLGYGRGYYDRWFPKNTVKTKIGIAYEEQIIDKLPIDNTDIPMDVIITEEGVTNIKE